MRALAGVPPGIWLPAALMLAAAPIAIGCLRHWLFDQYCALFLLQIVLYGIAAWAYSSRTPTPRMYGRRALIAILIVAALLRLIALCAPVFLSSDAYRYVWDGRVQAAGINPYRYIPADPQLSFLRDETIYPDINRADYAHTIYPPTAQIGFFVFEHISDSLMGMKIGMLACDGLSIGCLIALLRERGLPARTCAALCLASPARLGIRGHGARGCDCNRPPAAEFSARRAPRTGMDWHRARCRNARQILSDHRRAGALSTLGLAHALVCHRDHGVALPSLYERRLRRIGFHAWLRERGGSAQWQRIFPLGAARAHRALPADGIRYYLPFAAIVMGALAAWVQFGRSRISQDASGVLGTYVLASAFVLLFSPHNAWYFAWLVPFLCFRFSIAHLWLTSVCVLIYTYPNPFGLDLHLLLYLPFILLLFMQYGLARRRANLVRHLPERIDAEPVHRHSS
jgi:alpha-1,6-mannosyltransferase